MTSDFNIRNSLWDPSFPHHSSISDNLIIVADSFNLDLLILTNQVPTRYSDIVGESNSIIDLMFLRSRLTELNNHLIYPDQRLTSDHASLTVSIPIVEENVITFKQSIIKNSEEEANFVKEVSSIIKNLNVFNLTDTDKLEDVNIFTSNIEHAWERNSKCINIMKHSKSQQNEEYSQSLGKYRMSRNLDNQRSFKRTVKITKKSFFDLKIQEITNKNQGPWKLMNWVNKCKLLAVKAIKYENQPYLTINSLQHALHSTFNSTLNCQANIDILNKIVDKLSSSWAPFSKEEFRSVIANCNNSFTPRPNRLL